MEEAFNLAELQVLCDNFIRNNSQILADNEYKVMLFLRIYGESVPKVLINKIGILKTNLATTLKRLAKANLIITRKNSQDSRSKIYTLTPKGNDVIDDVIKNLYDHLYPHITEDFFYALKIVLSVMNKAL